MEFSFIVILALSTGPYMGTETVRFGDFTSMRICQEQMQQFVQARLTAYRNYKVNARVTSATCSPNKQS